MEYHRTKDILPFPTPLLEELTRLIPAGKRSEVIVEATAAYLHRLRVLVTLEQTGGVWCDGDHADLATAEDVTRWVNDLRDPWRCVPLLSPTRQSH